MQLRLLPCVILGLTCSSVLAKDMNVSASPRYFGPNALPVPEMLEGTVSQRLYMEVAFDLAAGFHGDLTKTLCAQIRVPLFSSRVNLSLWMPVVEFYTNTAESLEWQNSQKRRYRGHEFGNVYISTDMRVLRQTRHRPDITVRAAVITASGDSEEYARYFDAPGYFLDTSISKSIEFASELFRSLRVTVNGGFLCWQTDKSRQNDAYMYGVKAKLDICLMNLSAAWQGYTGWQNNGDRPMVFRIEAVFNAGRLHPLLAFEHGIRDYPFNHFRVGLGYGF